MIRDRQLGAVWYSDPKLWIELFVLVNLAFLTLDIYIAHSVNQFRHSAEYVPFYFSLCAPAVLAVGLVMEHKWRHSTAWRDLGYLVGWLAVGVGVAGVVLHLDSRFFLNVRLKA